MKQQTEHLEFSREVRQALDNGRPVLALESTIITHGMPFPRSLGAAQSAQQEVRDHGATPATIAIIDGHLKVGLEEEEIQRLARAGDDAVKCSRRDIPFVMQSGKTGGTTVAATMIVAAMAGIRVFATGGIGGVHRGAEDSMDVSADLQELARTSVAVVCAGPKSILDIGLTLEYLETHGVPVIGFHTDELPAFYTRESGFGVDYRMDSASNVALALKKKWSMGLDGGVVIANPIPRSAAMQNDVLESIIQEALGDAAKQQISGKELTPFLLDRVEKLTGGASLETNVQLMMHNARVGADIAVAMG